MKISKIIDVLTKDDQESFTLDDLVGTPAASAYLINYGFQGYGKFKFDAKSIEAFAQTGLVKIEDAMSRKYIYRVLHDMLKNQDICGVEVLEIIEANLPDETSVDVLACCLNVVIPIVIKSYLPLQLYNDKKNQMFKMMF